jgi:hypothetical protein
MGWRTKVRRVASWRPCRYALYVLVAVGVYLLASRAMEDTALPETYAFLALVLLIVVDFALTANKDAFTPGSGPPSEPGDRLLWLMTFEERHRPLKKPLTGRGRLVGVGGLVGSFIAFVLLGIWLR